MIRGLLPLSPSICHGCCRPRWGAPVRRIGKQNSKKFPASLEFSRGPDAGVYHIKEDFHGLVVNPIGSYLFLQSH